ncbi:PREDICTED: uncharacterized protein LOC109234682 [Nicotiana attenuata]|uniref:uncharacterized protein LOC109234682 n=1 Tax=Nicotiana attenuata TaxID=49451 RepID=UPI0009049D70|nr:PREDICTED: uncharacterized protein LOC109234682 [Nicotiana attenuata]
MRKNESYQHASRQEVNKEKSCFITYHYLDPRIKKWNNYEQSNIPFTYLDSPIYTGRKRINLFTDLATKVVSKAGAWQSKILTTGGKALIIKHILSSQTLHLFAAMEPPMSILLQIQKYFSNFFRGMNEGKSKYRWCFWRNMCYPIEEGGLGFK